MQINSSNLPEIKKHFPTVTWRVLAYDACASFWVGTWWLYRKIVDRKGNVFEGIADYNSKTPKVRAKYIFNFMVKYNRRIQQRNGMGELYQWTQQPPRYNGHIAKNVPEQDKGLRLIKASFRACSLASSTQLTPYEKVLSYAKIIDEFKGDGYAIDRISNSFAKGKDAIGVADFKFCQHVALSP